MSHEISNVSMFLVMENKPSGIIFSEVIGDADTLPAS